MENVCEDALRLILSFSDKDYWNALTLTCKRFNDILQTFDKFVVDIDAILGDMFLTSWIWNIDASQVKVTKKQLYSLVDLDVEEELLIQTLPYFFRHHTREIQEEISSELNLHKLVEKGYIGALETILEFLPSLPYNPSFLHAIVTLDSIDIYRWRMEACNKWNEARGETQERVGNPSLIYLLHSRCTKIISYELDIMERDCVSTTSVHVALSRRRCIPEIERRVISLLQTTKLETDSEGDSDKENVDPEDADNEDALLFSSRVKNKKVWGYCSSKTAIKKLDYDSQDV